jgi:hypothetical protein
MVTPAPARFVVATWTIVVISIASSSYAQELHPYVGGAVGSFSVTADEVDGTSAPAGLVAGLSFWKYADVEVEILVPTEALTRSCTGISHPFALDRG